MSTFSKILLMGYFGIFMFALGKYSYVDKDGVGFYIPEVGGYHYDTTKEK